jgi:peptide/nickel transport system substrate-binding protein
MACGTDLSILEEKDMQRDKWTLISVLFGMMSVALAACRPEAIEIERTVLVTQVVEIESTPIVQVVTPTPEPTEEEESLLVICVGQEPDTLYEYGGSTLAGAHIKQAIYDGHGWGGGDMRAYGYQPIIVEKVPSLADGDAVIDVVTVAPGDQIVGDAGRPVTLEEGVLVRPAGCRSSECAQEYGGSGEIEMDQMAVTFRMVPGLQWSDGVPLTVNDSVYSYELARDPDTPKTSKFTEARTASYMALDELTVIWTGMPGFIDPEYFANFWLPLPEHIWGRFTAAELVDAEASSRRPLGYGPYVIDEWRSGEGILMHRNENYFRAQEGYPKFDNLMFRFVGENANANIARILSGECDVVDQTAGLDGQSELMLELHHSEQLDAIFVTGTVWEHADFGISPATFDNGWVQSQDRPDFFGDPATRQAIGLCMDRQAVVDAVTLGQSVVLDTYLPPEHPMFNPDVTQYDYDLSAGSALLEEVGWLDEDDDPSTPRVYRGANDRIPPGTPLEFTFWTTSTPQRQQAAQILARSMAQCGIKADLEYWDSREFFANGPDGPIFGRRFDLGQFAWLTGVEPPCDLYLTSQIPSMDTQWAGQNIPGFSNQEFDQACNQARQSLQGEPPYRENHLRAQEIFAEELPVVPLYLRLKLAGTRPDMCHFEMDSTENSEMWNIEAFDYGPDCE